MAEYFIPDEGSKLDLWTNPDVPTQRVSVFINITNPVQLGELIRSAVSLGSDTILLMDGCADPYATEVTDVSHAAQVTGGGYPRFHILRPEDGDDPWGIINRMIRTHNLLPVTLGGDSRTTDTPDTLWRGLGEENDLDRKMIMFSGSQEHGLDVDYVKHNIEVEVKEVTCGVTSMAGLPEVL